MLVLSRKANERINIGDDIKVVVYKIRDKRVTIGIEAPDGVRILRGELLKKMAGEPAPIGGETEG